jgi:peptidoglycan/LPS O-acetylase OafA/YrhL
VVSSKNKAPVSLIRPFYPGLTGLRGFAILMVFIAHRGPIFMSRPLAEQGRWGVDLFFVLSGFLITGILYDSKGDKHFFRNFYIRRALRIFPLYYGFFLLVALLTPLFHLGYDRIMWSNLLYLGNFTEKALYTGGPNPMAITFPRFHGSLITVQIGAFWSLCVEEQFYLVWPFVVWLLPSRNAMMRFCLIAAFVVLCLRTFLYVHDTAEAVQSYYLYYSTYTRCDTLFIGAWIALWLRGVKLTVSYVHRIAYALITIPGVILVTGAAKTAHWLPNEVDPLICTYGYTLVALVSSGVLLLALEDTSWLHRIFKNRHLTNLGLISYGFYVFHDMPTSMLVGANKFFFARRHLSFPLALASFLLTYLVAWLSFHFYESRFLNMKERLAPGHRSVPSGNEAVAL